MINTFHWKLVLKDFDQDADDDNDDNENSFDDTIGRMMTRSSLKTNDNDDSENSYMMTWLLGENTR